MRETGGTLFGRRGDGYRMRCSATVACCAAGKQRSFGEPTLRVRARAGCRHSRPAVALMWRGDRQHMRSPVTRDGAAGTRGPWWRSCETEIVNTHADIHGAASSVGVIRRGAARELTFAVRQVGVRGGQRTPPKAEDAHLPCDVSSFVNHAAASPRRCNGGSKMLSLARCRLRCRIRHRGTGRGSDEGRYLTIWPSGRQNARTKVNCALCQPP